MRRYIPLMFCMFLFASGPAKAQWAVFDAPNSMQNLLAYAEMLLRTAQEIKKLKYQKNLMNTTNDSYVMQGEQFALQAEQRGIQEENAGINNETLATVAAELDLTMERVRGLIEKNGLDAFKDVIANHVDIYGSSPVSEAVHDVDVEDAESFRAATVLLFEEHLGGLPVDDETIDTMAGMIANEEDKDAYKRSLKTMTARNDVYLDNIAVAAKYDKRKGELDEKLLHLETQLQSLGDASDVATLQLIAAISLAQAQQNQAMLGAMTAILASQNEADLQANMDDLQKKVDAFNATQTPKSTGAKKTTVLKLH